jgi:type III pantothenate kinase
MVLAVDIGNSNIVIGCFEGDDIRLLERMSTNRNSTALEYAVLIKTVLELNGLSKHAFDGGIISSVVPSVTNMVKAAIEKLIGKPPMVVGPGLKTGLKINLDNPAQLGCDRVADAVAAINSYPCPLIIIDMGTATTISVVDEHKNFIGGMIMPGLRISAESLSSKTSQLPQISLDPPKRAIGRNTTDCMRSGIILGCASTIDGAIKHIENELGQTCTVVSTGGHASIVTPFCKRQIIVDDKLLLKGMMVIYRKNCI